MVPMTAICCCCVLRPWQLHQGSGPRRGRAEAVIREVGLVRPTAPLRSSSHLACRRRPAFRRRLHLSLLVPLPLICLQPSACPPSWWFRKRKKNMNTGYLTIDDNLSKEGWNSKVQVMKLQLVGVGAAQGMIEHQSPGCSTSGIGFTIFISSWNRAMPFS